MFHQTIVAGYLGADPEMRFTANGNAVTNFSVAASERWTDAAGQKQEHTEWYRCTAWGKTAEIISEHFQKGKPIQVVGRNRTRKYEDRDGNTRYATDLMVQSFVFLPDGKGQSREPAGADQYDRPQQGGLPVGADGDGDIEPDDLPF